MKKAILIIVWLAGVSQVNAQVSSDSLKTGKNIIKTDVTVLLLTTTYNLNASWEHLLSKNSSLELGTSIWKPYLDIGYGNFRLSAEILYRRYFNKNKHQMKGFYVAPFAEFRWRHRRNYNLYNYEVINKDYNCLIAGLQAGYQWIVKKRWIIDLNVRAGINLLSNNPHKKGQLTGYLPSLKIGYKF